METKSRLLIMDVWLKEPITSLTWQALDSAINQSFTVVDRIEHQFVPHGMTRAYILSESHCVVHSYPEKNYYSIDISVCSGSINLELIKEQILSRLEVKDFTCQVLRRG